MNILFLDVELAPNLATVWGIWNQNIAINQLLETSRVLCFAAQWKGDKEVLFYSEYKEGRKEMLNTLLQLLDKADAVVHYNGKKFDIPVINREFLLEKMLPPSPSHQIDLLEVVKKRFRFVSNKLDHVAKELGIGGKVKHTGHQLWLDCMSNKESAWKLMEKYNKQDVKLLVKLYTYLLPWIKNHPNLALYTDVNSPVCTNCGSNYLIKRGMQHTRTQSYQRYLCKKCGTWNRGRFTTLDKDKREGVMIQC